MSVLNGRIERKPVIIEKGDLFAMVNPPNNNWGCFWIVVLVAIICLCNKRSKGEQLTFNPTNNRTVSQSKSLTDLEQHCSNPIRDKDLVHYAHETTHVCNARVHDYCKLNGAGTGLYCYDNVGFAIKETGVKMIALANAIPLEYRRSGAYQTYIIDSVRLNPDYANRPGYIMDEWVAYTNGCVCGVEQRVDNQRIDFSFDHCCQLGIFTVLLDRLKPNPNIQEVIKFQTVRMGKLHSTFKVSDNTEKWYQIYLKHVDKDILPVEKPKSKEVELIK